jgi:MYXO-CTERM domain-containing protein
MTLGSQVVPEPLAPAHSIAVSHWAKSALRCAATMPSKISRFRTRLLAGSLLSAVAAGALTLASPSTAEGFCGFYVAGAETELYNNATMVVLMRDGTRTVLSMQNNYQGPPQDFAMVVPVPVVLQKDDVKVLPDEVFDRVDKLAAPRLVEYWEQDPCQPWGMYPEEMQAAGAIPPPSPEAAEDRAKDLGVTIEAKFEVGEYQVVILSAKDSTGLDKWLKLENYSIPDGAEPLLRPYVQSGSKFFVAKVDAKKVKFDAKGQAKLSPLRFHYDSPEFALPVRLGLINAPDGQGTKQDLIIHILARGVRYATSNYDNVAIPTNLDVKNETREHFGEFYASLFDHVLANNPKAVVTEYAWAANSCDPCPEEPLNLAELVTLGADVLPSYAQLFGPNQKISEDYQWSIPGEFVLTRLHARYDSSSLGEDLVFEAAPAIVGGREFMQQDGQLERGAVEEPGGWNNFQARYIIRHAWEGPIECAEPQRGIWGGPWPEVQNADSRPVPAQDLAFVPRGGSLETYVTESAKMEIEHSVGKLPDGPIEAPPPDPKQPGIVGYGGGGEGCAHCSVEQAGAGGALAFGLGLLALLGLRRRPRKD